MSKVFYRAIITFVIVFSFQSGVSKENAEISKIDNRLSEMQVEKNLASMSLSFTENKGQWDEKVKFRANAGGATMWFGPDGAYYQFTRTIKSEDAKTELTTLESINKLPELYETMMIKANFVGANLNPQMVGVDMIDYKCNYFIGNDKSKWATDVPNYTAVIYEEIYDGIDLKYYGNGKQMEYDFIVSPGADFSQIKIQYEGAESVAVNDNGQLVVTTMWGEVVEQRPVIYQVENNLRIPVSGKYKMNGASSFSFELADYDASLELVIDPILEYSTYLGGSGFDRSYSLAVDSIGATYITGYVRSTDFPTLNPFQDTLQGFQGSYDIFVTKLSNLGNSLIYSTYLGGADREEANSIAVDLLGATYLTGFTRSTDFPLLNSIQDSLQGNDDVFVVKLNSSGNSLVFSTYLGGSLDDEGTSIAVDASGNAYVTGLTRSSEFPLENSYQDSIKGVTAVFVAKLSSSGENLDYSTFLGGSGGQRGNAIAVDASGMAYVTGQTSSSDFPMLNPYQNTIQGSEDVFVTKFSVSGNSLVYSTYIGGSSLDAANDIAIDNIGAVYLTGGTWSTDFPILNAYQTTHNGGMWDVFVTKLNTSGDSLIYSTYLGGTGFEVSKGIAVDVLGAVYVTGETSSIDYPTLNPYEGTYQGNGDIFVTKINSLGDNLSFSTYLGGSSDDVGNDIVVDLAGAVYITGLTNSSNFPTLNSYISARPGAFDASVTKFSAVATDIKEYDIDNLPSDFNMSQNYPNPFNPTTTIEFNLPTKSNVTVTIYNLLGQEVQQLVNQEYSAGNYRVTWNGTSSNGVQTSTGIYFYRIVTDDFVETKKMLLLK